MLKGLAHKPVATSISQKADAPHGDRHTSLLIDSVPAWISYLDRDYRYRLANKKYLDNFGAPPDGIIGLHIHDVLPASNWALAEPYLKRAMAGETVAFDSKIRQKSGNLRYIHIQYVPDIVDGVVNGVYTLVTDITERKIAEDALKSAHRELERRLEENASALRDSELRFQHIFEDGHLGMFLVSSDRKLRSVNDAFCRLLGYAKTELEGVSVLDITHPDDIEATIENLTDLFEHEIGTRRTEKRYVAKSGRPIWVAKTMSLIRARNGQATYSLAMIEDITDRKYAKEAAKKSDRRFRRVFQGSPLGMAISVQNGTLAETNEAFSRILGYSADELHEISMADITHPDDVERSRACMERLYDGESDTVDVEKRYITKDGKTIWAHTTLSAVRNEIGEIEYDIAIIEDITEAKALRESLQIAEQRIRAFFEHTPDGILLKDTDLRIVDMNRVHQQWHGGFIEDLVGKTAHDLFTPEIAEALTAEDLQVLESDGPVGSEREAMFGDGTTRVLQQLKFPMRDGDGKVIGIGAVNRDVTEQRRAESQLRAAQRMEAVGRLTGGVAHDFNNLLAVIIGNLELVLDPVGEIADSRAMLRRAVEAADKGAALVQRLLAFSRSQTLAPEVVHTAAIIAEMQDILRQSLSEAVAIKIDCTPDLWSCKVDPTQFENAVLNLAVNAGDAMPNGGQFAIVACNVSLDREQCGKVDILPGDYVHLRISDTGEGMSEETVSRAVEPFFTTKDVGEGTGLGLSMVDGFVTQSGGGMLIESAPGSGTVIDIYLPRCATARSRRTAGGEPVQVPRGNGETVLVVEDDPMVRSLVVSQLEALGYATLQAEDGPKALDIVANAPAIDLLLTDIVLPNGMNGRQVADQVLSQRAEVRVVFMSGYSDDVFDNYDITSAQGRLIQKPFRKPQIARALADALQA